MANKKDLNFKESLENLQTIINDIESGKIDIDEIVIKFQEGKKLINQLTDKLDEIERKVNEIEKESEKK